MSPTQLILVHGTFAALPEDTGTAWWQNGSDFSSWLLAEAGGRAELPARVFHWSGENSEHERREGGRALLRLLREREREGRTYHLIAHSHGGSVIWHALQEAATDGGPKLDGLRSWATVGTPFLIYSPTAPDVWRPATLIGTLALSALLLDRATVGWSLLRALPQAGGPDLAIVGFYVLCLALLYLLAWGTAGVLRTATYFWLLRRRRHRFERAWAEFGGRHAGFWSREDEAIAGLANTLSFGGPIIPRPRPEDGSLVERMGTVLRWPFRLLFRLAAPVGDALVWEATSRNLQGTDIDGERMTAVRTLPMVDVIPDPPLSAAADAEIVQRANAAAGGTLARMRSALGTSFLARPHAPAFIREVTGVLTAEELVHTSYFAHPEVRRRLLDHILTAEGTPQSGSNGGQEPLQPSPSATAQAAVRLAPPAPLLRARAAAVIAAAVAVWAAAVRVYDGGILPYTDEHQLRSAFVVAPFAEYAADADRVVSSVNDDWFRALAWLPAACGTSGHQRTCTSEDALSWSRVLPTAGKGDSVVSVLHLAAQIEDPYQRVSALAAFAGEAVKSAREAQRTATASGAPADAPIVADWGPARRLANALAHSPAALRWGHESMAAAHAYQPLIEAMLRVVLEAAEPTAPPATAALSRQAAVREVGAAAELVDSMASTLLPHLRQVVQSDSFTPTMNPDLAMLRARVDSANAAVGLQRRVWRPAVDTAVSHLRRLMQRNGPETESQQEALDRLSTTVSRLAAAGDAAGAVAALKVVRDSAWAYRAQTQEIMRSGGYKDWRDHGDYLTAQATATFDSAVEILARRHALDAARHHARALGIGKEFEIHTWVEPFLRVPADAFTSGEFLRLERRAIAFADTGQRAHALTLLAEHALRGRHYEEARRIGSAAAALLAEPPTAEDELNPGHPSDRSGGARRVLPTLAFAEAALGLDSAAVVTALKLDAGGELEPVADERLLRSLTSQVVRSGRAESFRTAIRRATRLRHERSQVYRVLATVLAERGALRPACRLLQEERGLELSDEVAASAAIIRAYGHTRARRAPA